MNGFIYQYPVKQCFGKGCAEEAIKRELKTVGDNVLLAYGGGSLKRTGLYDKLWTWLKEAGKMETYMGKPQATNLSDEINEAVIHPALYRRLLDAGKEKLARMAETVWQVKGTMTGETAMRGIETLEAFIREIGLPTHWSEMDITDESLLRAAADTCIITPGCCRQLTRDEIFELLMERM